MARLVPIKEASAILGVSPDTLRRWQMEGKITSQRTDEGHRGHRDTQSAQNAPALYAQACALCAYGDSRGCTHWAYFEFCSCSVLYGHILNFEFFIIPYAFGLNADVPLRR